jgi:hypothetical protein
MCCLITIAHSSPLSKLRGTLRCFYENLKRKGLFWDQTSALQPMLALTNGTYDIREGEGLLAQFPACVFSNPHFGVSPLITRFFLQMEPSPYIEVYSDRTPHQANLVFSTFSPARSKSFGIGGRYPQEDKNATR